MDYETPTGVPLDVDDDEGRLKPNLDEQLPLQVYSSEDGCFVYDNHGAEVGYTYKQDWEDDPKGHIVWMADELRRAYEEPVDTLTQAAQYEPMFLFYDTEYPNDDVPCKETNERRFFEKRELPLLNEQDSTDPQESPLTVMTEDHYAEGPPSVIQILDGESDIKKWTVEYTEDKAANVRLGAEVAWNIRLAYECPWELRP